ncbi:aspartic proteinase nepenthesin-2-like [Papaver somniferum]|uniref:aspartic proteinase nepenthesin-2-like n=1 Tax=Papaver somniferum TaxID=3469 RepID=UPI000E7023FA|nr:aspartic proteinase nepenthesin-2-like [Papaver somniferum]
MVPKKSFYLRFSSDATIGDDGPEAVHTTPIFRNPYFGTPYHLHLEDISIGDQRVKFAKGDFQIKPDGKGGSIIDSGAPLSTMYKPHFERVKQVLVKHMEAQGARLDVPEHSLLDPCFAIPPTFDPNEFPTITFHFQQADYVVDQVSDIFFSDDDGALFCFGIVGVDVADHGGVYDFVLGAMQQANKRISYDVRKETLSFTKENCQMGS